MAFIKFTTSSGNLYADSSDIKFLGKDSSGDLIGTAEINGIVISGITAAVILVSDETDGTVNEVALP